MLCAAAALGGVAITWAVLADPGPYPATTVAAVLLPGQRTPALHSLLSDSPTILRFVDRLRRTGPVQCCYEAGPCGFELQRALTTKQIPCEVIAPA